MTRKRTDLNFAGVVEKSATFEDFIQETEKRFTRILCLRMLGWQLFARGSPKIKSIAGYGTSPQKSSMVWIRSATP